MDIMKNLTVCLSKRFRLYKTSIISNFPSSFGNCHSRSVFFFFLKNKQTNKKPQACNGLKKKKALFSLAGSPIFPRAFHELGFCRHFSFNSPVAAEESIGLKGRVFLLFIFPQACSLTWTYTQAPRWRGHGCWAQLPWCASKGLWHFPK